jgi:cation:H+ antiporter
LIAEWVELTVGLILLVGGAQLLVAGASRLAASFGVSELVIGLTVVAFATSAPELTVNLFAAVEEKTALAFGNVVGSNIANIALVVGVCALVRPLVVESQAVSTEIRIMLAASVVAALLAWDPGIGGGDLYGRADGLILLALFAAFMVFSVRKVLREQEKATEAEGTVGAAQTPGRRSTGASAMMAIAGLGALSFGADAAVTSSVDLASRLGVSDAMIGLSIIAIGTSLPELTTSVLATWQGRTDLAVGNVVGSNIFNLLFILGITASVHPVPVPQPSGWNDLLAMTALCVVLIPVSSAGRATIPRLAGAVFVAAYFGYLTWRWLSG